MQTANFYSFLEKELKKVFINTWVNNMLNPMSQKQQGMGLSACRWMTSQIWINCFQHDWANGHMRDGFFHLEPAGRRKKTITQACSRVQRRGIPLITYRCVQPTSELISCNTHMLSSRHAKSTLRTAIFTSERGDGEASSTQHPKPVSRSSDTCERH